MKKREEEWKGKRVLVVGLGRSGMAACSALQKLGADVAVQDSKTEEELDRKILNTLKRKKIDRWLGEPPEDPADFDCYVVSPGVPLSVEFIQQAQAAGVSLIGELELAYRLAPGKFIAITGTNGKTTTTALVGEMFRRAGKKTEVVGNIGVAAVEKAMEADEDTWLITEVSSFQLETIDQFCPAVSAILNLSPDHLDRHGSLENYANAKARIFENQEESGYTVMNFDDKASFPMAPRSRATIVPFSREEKLMFGAYLKGEQIVVKNHEEEIIEFCSVEELLIPGTHNLENALAATAIGYFAGLDPESIRQALRSFGGVEHRIEDCGMVDGVHYINDSKGTNIDAAMKAIAAVEGRIILIAGGYDKGADYSGFVRSFGNKVKHVVLLGATASKIKITAEKMGYPHTTMMKDMEDCVQEAARRAEAGDTVLLSPACASWDMYEDFEERGNHFKQCVERLRQK